MSDKFTRGTLSKFSSFSLKDANCLTPLLVQWTHLCKMDTWALSFWFSYLEGLTTVYICSDPSKRSVNMLVEFMVMHDVLLLYCVLDKQHVQVLPCSLLNKWDRFFLFNHLAC